MTIAYFDCFAGAAGDMIVGSLLDAGADFEALRAELAKLGLEGYSLRSESVRRGGLGGTKFHVDLHDPAGEHGDKHDGHSHEHEHGEGREHHEHAHGSEAHPHAHPHGPEAHPHAHEHRHEPEPCEDVATPHRHRGLTEILAMIDAANLSPQVTQRAKAIFTRLGHAESKVHRIPVEEVHFHEVGAVDSIVDIVGSCIALELLQVEQVLCSPIPPGSGTIRCAHGLLPAPSPATAALLRDAVLATNVLKGEVTTPTAAAVLTALSASYGPLPPMKVLSIGYGAGTREGDEIPNLLRVFIGEACEDASADTVVELSANIDDATGEIVGSTIGRLIDLGCLDAWATPIYMKKNRPAWMLSALAPFADADAAEAMIFAETTTFGVRRRTCTRSKLQRRHVTVETPYGPVRVKVGSHRGADITAAPEFADCQAAATSHHVSVRQVIEAAQGAYRANPQREGDARDAKGKGVQ